MIGVVSIECINKIYFFIFLAFDFCRFCVVIRFFHPRHNGQWPPTSKDFYTRSYALHYFLILILQKESAFPFLTLRAKQGIYGYHFYNVLGMTRFLTRDRTWDLPHYWYHFYNIFGMTRSLTEDWTPDLPHSKPAL